MSLAIPGTEPIQVGVSDTYYSSVDTDTHSAMVLCTTLQTPIPLNTAIFESCVFGTFGRYIYIYLIRGDSNNARIELYEVEVYMGKWLVYGAKVNGMHRHRVWLMKLS